MGVTQAKDSPTQAGRLEGGQPGFRRCRLSPGSPERRFFPGGDMAPPGSRDRHKTSVIPFSIARYREHHFILAPR